jgi:hypothetical protein
MPLYADERRAMGHVPNDAGELTTDTEKTGERVYYARAHRGRR